MKSLSLSKVTPEKIVMDAILTCVLPASSYTCTNILLIYAYMHTHKYSLAFKNGSELYILT